MSKPKFKAAIDLFVPSATIIRDNLMPYALVLILPLLLTTIGEVTKSDDNLGMGGTGVLGVLLSIAFLPPLTKLYLITAKGKQATVEEIFNGSYAYFWRLLGVAIVVGLAIIIGFFLLIIPGLIMFRRYALSPFYLMDKNLGIREAMSKSAEQSKPYSWRLYDVLAIIVLIGIIGLFGPFGMVISTVLSIIYSVALPLRYYEIQKTHQS